jgi:hypothetical protein
MTEARPDLASPDDVAAYRRGAPSSAADFAFLVGDWEVEATRYGDDGAELLRHPGRWRAEWLFGGRVLFDAFVGTGPDGAEIGAAATLRTYCQETGRWEMTFLRAGQANRLTSFHGRREGDVMRLEARGLDRRERPLEARVRFFDIRPDAFAWEQESRLVGAKAWYRDAAMRAKRVA